ncbi:MAG TPA: PAS domain S-box protein, partial [Verrucomicrobiae bacterium]|nr:PAS domain S-box protein [Verrucomicrobiae bacterium]
PIMSGEKFLGAMEFFSHNLREPDPELLDMFSGIGSQIGLFMERKRAEEALSQNARLLDLSHDAIFVWDLDGKIRYWNEGAEQLYGYHPEEAVGRVSHELLATIHPQGTAAFLAKLERDGEWTGELVHTAKDGRVLTVETRQQIIHRADRRRLVLESNRDVTERKNAQAALQEAHDQLEERIWERTAELAEANARFQAMFDQGLFAGLMTPDGILIDANRSSLESCGFTRDEVVGKPLWETGWWNRSPQVQAWLKAGFAEAVQGRRFHGESIYFTADGTERIIDFALMPIKDDGGKLLYVMPTGMDITDWKRAEEEVRDAEVLRESEALFRNMADNAPVLVWMSDTTRNCTWFNKVWLDFVGRPLEKEIGNGWAENVHPEDMDRCLKTYVETSDARQQFEMEYRLRRHDGEYRWILDRGSPAYGEAGEFTGYVGSCIDITERRLAEQNLQASQARFAGLIESAMDAIIAVDDAQRVVLFNPAAEQVFGWTAREAVGKSIDQFIPSRFREAHRKHIQNFGEHGVTSRRMGALGTLSGLRANGQEFPIEASISHMNVDGKKLFTVILRDITERKKAETVIRELASIVEFSDDAIIAKDLNDIITSWNSGAERLYGYTAGEAIGKPITLVVPADRHWEDPEMLARLKRGETIQHHETIRVTKDGRRIDVSLTVSPIRDADGNIIGVSKIGRDITERKKIEAELKAWRHELELRVEERTVDLVLAHKQLQSQIEERKRLEAEIARAIEHEQLRLGQELHDGLGQQLAGMRYMMGALQVKLTRLPGSGAEEARKLETLLQQCIEQARNLAKGFYPVELERRGLFFALKEISHTIEQSFGVRCILQVDEAVCPEPKGTAAIQLFRVVQEAMHNAVKHATARNIVIRLLTTDGQTVLTVQDDGIGLPRDVNKTKGMGLRIMDYRARLIGAQLELRNGSTGGTVVSCSFPAEERVPPSETQPAYGTGQA